MPTNAPVNLWASAEHASDYLGRADSVPHRTEGEATLLEFIPVNARRVLDLGTGGGRLLALVKAALPANPKKVHGQKWNPWRSTFLPPCSKPLANASPKIRRSPS